MTRAVLQARRDGKAALFLQRLALSAGRFLFDVRAVINRTQTLMSLLLFFCDVARGLGESLTRFEGTYSRGVRLRETASTRT
jgi:hypothetical protein